MQQSKTETIFARLVALFIYTASDANFTDQAPAVGRVDSAIHLINHYPLNNLIGFSIVYPLYSDLSGA